MNREFAKWCENKTKKNLIGVNVEVTYICDHAFGITKRIQKRLFLLVPTFVKEGKLSKGKGVYHIHI